MTSPLSRDRTLEDVLRRVRLRHRQFQRSGFSRLSNRALREAERAESAMDAEEVLEPLCSDLAGASAKRPGLPEWLGAHGAMSQARDANDALLKHLAFATHNVSEPLQAEEVETLMTDASAIFREKMEATKTPPRKQGKRQRNMSREAKKRLRRTAREEFEATVAGVALARVARLNPGSPDAVTVGAGALRRP